MNNKSKGFTLIELLAVIVILAIIALIVTPVVSNIVANARIAANARSVEGHIRNIEIAIISEAFSGTTTGDLDKYDNITSGTTIESSLTIPDNDNVTCKSYNIEHGTIISATNCKDTDKNWIKKYGYTKESGAVVTGTVGVSDFKGTFVEAGEGDTHKGIVYMDPTNIKTVCTATSDVAITARTTKSGCMKFYIYDDNGDTYKMILDRNTTGNQSIISLNSYKSAAAVVGKTNEEATADWNSYLKTIYGFLDLNSKFATDTANWIGNPRLPHANEIVNIVDKTTTWNSSETTTRYCFGSGTNVTYNNQTDSQKEKQESYYWLFDFIKECDTYGCQNAISENYSGYWTDSKVLSYSRPENNVWFINRYGCVEQDDRAVNQTWYGIRPVIEISKDLIED